MPETLLDKLGLRRGRFRFLLSTLLLYCIASAAFPSIEAAGLVLALLLASATIFELEAGERSGLRKTVMLTAILFGAVRVLLFFGLDFASLASNVLDVVFAAGLTYTVQMAVRRPNRPAGDRIAGAICVYLLLGFAWAAVYSLIETAAPGSFHFPADLVRNASSSSFLYYSFVTLSTLGYGDITPASRIAGTFSWMEAITGQLYLAITIAALISLTLVEQREPKE